MISNRIQTTENPHIEDILDKYCHLPNISNLALGSSHWSPPQFAQDQIQQEIFSRDTHRYGSILGMPALRDKLRNILTHRNLQMDNMDIAITAGANQAFMNVALSLCDKDDHAIILSPYYFSHLLALQLSQAKVSICSFQKENLLPDWNELEHLFHSLKPKMLVLTSPNNPSGYIWGKEHLQKVIDYCRLYNTWLVVDQTYYEFLYEEHAHTIPCNTAFNYDQIIHIFSLSKVFAMPGWRVGYVVYPQSLQNSMRKIQDTIPTHATILSQKLASYCLDSYKFPNNQTCENDWFAEHLQSLQQVRDLLWPVVAPLGTVKTYGAFYFLVPLPPQIMEEEAVDILVKEYGILLMPGTPFGAPHHLRLSYGSIPPDMIVKAIGKIQQGFERLQLLSQQRVNNNL